MTAFDLLALGEPMIEFNQTRPGEPHYLQGYGGDTSNMIVAAARSGASTAYVTRLGDDAFGRLFLELWAQEGVDARGVRIDAAAHTGVYFVKHGPQGHEFSYLRAGSAASRASAAPQKQSPAPVASTARTSRPGMRSRRAPSLAITPAAPSLSRTCFAPWRCAQSSAASASSRPLSRRASSRLGKK